MSGRGRRWAVPRPAVLLVLVVLIASAAVVVRSAALGRVRLLSQGARASASSAAGRDVPARAVDGSTGTRWRSRPGGTPWLRVDLRQRSRLRRVVLDWDGQDYAARYRVEVSDDARTWAILAQGRGAPRVLTVPVSGTGRYVRVTGVSHSASDGWGLRELGAYGTPVRDDCGGRDVARARPVTASSTENPTLPARAAVDGNPHTRWSSAWSDQQWLRVDLGRDRPVCQVVLGWEHAYATGYDIQISDDATAWRTLYATTLGAGGRQVIYVSGAGRYLRLRLRAPGSRYGYSLWGMEVRSGRTAARTPRDTARRAGDAARGLDAADRAMLLSYRKPALASSSRDDGDCRRCDPASAVDGDPATRWADAGPAGTPGWIEVDLGAPAVIDRVTVQWGGRYPGGYEIQVSPDARTWATVYRGTMGGDLLQTLPAHGGGRYVRLYLSGAAGANGYSLWELRVYGAGGVPLPPPATPPAPSSQPPHLVWDDEFDGPAGAPPDPRRWRPDVGPGVTGELQYYTDNHNAYQDGAGSLVLEARREVTPGTRCPPDPSGSTTCQYTSARLNTHGLFSFTYGRVEARIQVSATQGLWPAFWMIGDDLYTGQADWPACGEIDVMEHVGRAADEISATLHAPAYHGDVGIGGRYRAGADLAAGFHVYAADWRPDGITFSVDGNDFFTVDRATAERTRGPWVYDHPFVLLLDNAVGGPFPGPPDATTVLPQRMLVDYVRVYR